VTIVSTAFDQIARGEARALGIPDLPIIVIPHPFADLRDDEVHVIADRITPLVVEALTATAARREYRDPALAKS
jgi:hypothetical protein